jgi:hypothetical protein
MKNKESKETVLLYCGRNVEEMTKEELIEALKYSTKVIDRMITSAYEYNRHLFDDLVFLKNPWKR